MRNNTVTDPTHADISLYRAAVGFHRPQVHIDRTALHRAICAVPDGTAGHFKPCTADQANTTAGIESFAIADLTAVHSECARSGVYHNAATPSSGAVGDPGRTGHGKATVIYKHTTAPAADMTSSDGAAGHHEVSF